MFIKKLNILFFLKNIDFIFDKYVIFIFQKNCFYLVWYYFNIYYGKVMKEEILNEIYNNVKIFVR